MDISKLNECSDSATNVPITVPTTLVLCISLGLYNCR